MRRDIVHLKRPDPVTETRAMQYRIYLTRISETFIYPGAANTHGRKLLQK